MFLNNGFLRQVAGLALLSAFSAAWALGDEHVHGQAQMYVMQMDDQWQVELTLVAADILGFEHAPKTEQELNRLEALQQQLGQPDRFLRMPSYCELLHGKVRLPEYQEHHHHEVQDQDEHHHQDVTATYQFRCSSAVDQISVELFAMAPAIQRVQVQWSGDMGQGTASLTPPNTMLRWQR